MTARRSTAYDPATVAAGREAAKQLPPITDQQAARASALLSLPLPTAGASTPPAVGPDPEQVAS